VLRLCFTCLPSSHFGGPQTLSHDEVYVNRSPFDRPLRSRGRPPFLSFDRPEPSVNPVEHDTPVFPDFWRLDPAFFCKHAGPWIYLTLSPL